MSLALSLYRLATRLAEPAAGSLLAARSRRGKEDPARLDERLGRPGLERPPRPLVWLHGVSVGESLSLLPLVEALGAARPDLALLVTTGTTTAAELMSRRLPPGVLHQYAPVDAPAAARRFFDHWRPSLGILVESELWPNLILAAKASGARLALVSARMTDKSAQGWARLPKAAAELLAVFDLVMPQDEASAARFDGLGARIGGLANLKLPAGPLPADEAALDEMRRALKGRQVILAASTHPGEEELIAGATPAGPCLIIVPRHPARGRELAAALSVRGRRVGLRSEGAALGAGSDIYLADTLGELGLFFRLADLVVLGGSFFDGIGGHNPLEPARLGKAPLHGPFVTNWTSVYASLGEGAAACRDEADLADRLAGLLADPAEAQRLNDVAQAAAQGHDRVIDGLMLKLSPLLPA